MALFTIHYENSSPISVSYTLDGKIQTEIIDDMLLDFLNTFDASHKYYRPECEQERFKAIYPDVQMLFSADHNYDTKNGTFGSPFDIYVSTGIPLPASLSSLAERFQDEIFQNPVYLSLNENKLIYNQSLKMQTPGLFGVLNDEFSHINELLHFDPAVFSIYKHFEMLKKLLIFALNQNVIPLNHTYNKWQRLYLQSDDFALRQLRTILEIYNGMQTSSSKPFNFICSDFGTRSDIDSFCLEYASAENPLVFSFSQAHRYQITKGDLFRAVFKKNQDKISSAYASKLQSDIKKAYSGFSEKALADRKTRQEIINGSGRILMDAFYSPEKYGQIKSASFQKNTISVEYKDFASDKTSSVSFPYPYTLDKVFEPLFGYGFNSKFVSPACAMYMAFSGGIDSNPFLYPILNSEFDMYEYVNIMPFHPFSYMIKDLEDIMDIDYRNATFDIETNSLTRVLVCLFDALHKNDSKVRKCLYCGKFFIASSGYDKYCDAALPKEIRESEYYKKKKLKKACSYLAKKNKALNRAPEIKELQSFRKNEQYYFVRESEFFDMENSVYNDRYDVQKGTLLVTSPTELNFVTAKLFSAIRCGILLCKYDNLKNQISNDLSTSDCDKEMLLAYGKSLLNHNFEEKDLPNNGNILCFYYNKNTRFPYQFNWEDELRIILDNNTNDFSAKAKSRIKELQKMIKHYVLWVKKNNILSEDTTAISAHTLETMEFLNNILPEEHSLYNKQMHIPKRRNKR